MVPEPDRAPLRPADWPVIPAVIVAGHGVASGRKGDPRFPGGTLAMQLPFFLERGLDLRDWHLGTINVSIAPYRYEILSARATFREVRWHPTEPAEDFSFFDCLADGCESLVYHPHPETKPEHEQPGDVLEIWACKRLPQIQAGSLLELRVDPSQIRFSLPPEIEPIYRFPK